MKTLKKYYYDPRTRAASTQSFTLWQQARTETAHCKHLPSLHCSFIGFPLDWESHKSLKHDRECLTSCLSAHVFSHTRFSESN